VNYSCSETNGHRERKKRHTTIGYDGTSEDGKRISDWQSPGLASYNSLRLDGGDPETFLAASTYSKDKKMYKGGYWQTIRNTSHPKGIEIKYTCACNISLSPTQNIFIPNTRHNRTRIRPRYRRRTYRLLPRYRTISYHVPRHLNVAHRQIPVSPTTGRIIKVQPQDEALRYNPSTDTSPIDIPIIRVPKAKYTGKESSFDNTIIDVRLTVPSLSHFIGTLIRSPPNSNFRDSWTSSRKSNTFHRMIRPFMQ